MKLPKMKFTAAGDMLIQRVISTEYEGFKKVSDYIKKGDARFFNFESIIYKEGIWGNQFNGGSFHNSDPKTLKIAEKYGFDIIPCGDAMELARDLEEFGTDAPLSMNRDGFHLSLDYGRYLAALVMCKYFTGVDATTVEYEPEGTDPQINKKLKVIANKAFDLI